MKYFQYSYNHSFKHLMLFDHSSILRKGYILFSDIHKVAKFRVAALPNNTIISQNPNSKRQRKMSRMYMYVCAKSKMKIFDQFLLFYFRLLPPRN